MPNKLYIINYILKKLNKLYINYILKKLNKLYIIVPHVIYNNYTNFRAKKTKEKKRVFIRFYFILTFIVFGIPLTLLHHGRRIRVPELLRVGRLRNESTSGVRINLDRTLKKRTEQVILEREGLGRIWCCTAFWVLYGILPVQLFVKIDIVLTFFFAFTGLVELSPPVADASSRRSWVELAASPAGAGAELVKSSASLWDS